MKRAYSDLGGLSSGSRHRREYKIWHGMVSRCTNPRIAKYQEYGAKGISVFSGWVGPGGFKAFFEYIGPAPSIAHSIDRFPNNRGNYEPGNVRWATSKEQCSNKTDNHVIEFDGKKMILREWAKVFGLNEQTVHERLKRGWSIEKALTTPIKKQVANV